MNLKTWFGGVSAFVILLAACGSASAVITGQYLFEEGSGTTALDTSGWLPARNGTLTGTTGMPEYVAGLYTGSNNALRFNYNSGTMAYDNALIQRITLPGSTDFVRNAAGMTMMAWVRPDLIAGTNGQAGFVGSSRSIVSVSDSFVTSPTPGTSTRGVLQIISASGQVRVLGRRVDGGNSASYTTAGATPFAMTLGQTYFVVGILDYVNASISVYVNGVQHTGGTNTNWSNLGTASPTNLSADTTNLSSHIGSNTAGLGEQWAGLVDGVRVFDSALSAQQILEVYNAEKLNVLDTSFDADTDTDGDDFLLWQRGLGTGPAPPATNAQGDADGNGVVNGADLANWRTRYGSLTSVPAAASVPEPAACALGVVGLAALAVRRRKVVSKTSTQVL